MTKKKNSGSTRLLLVCLAAAILIVGLVIAVVILALSKSENKTPKNYFYKKPTSSLMTEHKYSTIVTDAAPCVSIGNFIMLVKRGNVIDATIATMLCTGVYNLHSMGISGGSFLVYYDRLNKKTYTLDFREVAPLAATERMFVNTSSVYGGLSIAVPGEIAGYYEVWKRWGKVAWKDLFQPTIDLLRNGYRVYPSLKQYVDSKAPLINKSGSKALKDYIFNRKTGRLITTGDLRTHEKLADTMEIISNEPLAMYNGSLVNKIVKEIQSAGGIISAEDLRNYKPKWREALSIPLSGTPYIVHAMEPPSSGGLVPFILNVMSGYGYELKNISSKEDVGLYFHRFVEASKFAFAQRSSLGDMSFMNKTAENIFKNILNVRYADTVRENISDAHTFHQEYYGGAFKIPDEKGTSHLSAIDDEGNAVAMTSTINGDFGSLVMGDETGIMYNNEMDDFSTPGQNNLYNLPPSPSNFIKPGKRPMSSMSPIIVTEATTGQVRLVVGGSGGSRIISATSQVAGHHILAHKNIKEAIDMWRFHHQLYPNEILLGSDFPNELKEELKKRGHKFGAPIGGTAVQGLSIDSDGNIYGNADYRKNGQSGGI